MTSLTSLIRSKTSLALGLYLLAFMSLGFLANAQINAMRLVQRGRPVSTR